MMQFSCSTDSLGPLISICPSSEENSQKSKQIYSREFQAMLDRLDEEDYREEGSQSSSEKKRRLSFNQVKALEINFEAENRLEPERKAKLAEELGLQPRQVAIWFQNRRARWKTKQLEKDYGLLKDNYDALKHDYNKLEQENQALNKKLKELKARLTMKGHNENSSHSVKKESPVSETENNAMEQNKSHKFYDNVNAPPQMVSPAASSSSAPLTQSSTSPHSVMEWFQVSNSRVILNNVHQSQAVKVEDQNLFGVAAEESCNFLSVDQAPSLQWYFTGQ